MYAVIKTGGKQYRIEKDATVRVEKLEGDTGTTLEFEPLMVADGDAITIGAPTVSGARVTAEILGHGRGEKLVVFKFRRRKAYRKRNGHRQAFTTIKITGIAA